MSEQRGPDRITRRAETAFGAGLLNLKAAVADGSHGQQTDRIATADS